MALVAESLVTQRIPRVERCSLKGTGRKTGCRGCGVSSLARPTRSRVARRRRHVSPASSSERRGPKESRRSDPSPLKPPTLSPTLLTCSCVIERERLLSSVVEIVDKVECIVFVLQQQQLGSFKPVFQAGINECGFLVFPISCISFVGNFIHSRAADVDIDPFSLRSHHGAMDGLITIGLGGTYPIAKAFIVRFIYCGDD